MGVGLRLRILCPWGWLPYFGLKTLDDMFGVFFDLLDNQLYHSIAICVHRDAVSAIAITVFCVSFTDEKKATSLGVKPCLHDGNRKAPKVPAWGLFVCQL